MLNDLGVRSQETSHLPPMFLRTLHLKMFPLRSLPPGKKCDSLDHFAIRRPGYIKMPCIGALVKTLAELSVKPASLPDRAANEPWWAAQQTSDDYGPCSRLTAATRKASRRATQQSPVNSHNCEREFKTCFFKSKFVGQWVTRTATLDLK